jgi:hypothetical protein
MPEPSWPHNYNCGTYLDYLHPQKAHDRGSSQTSSQTPSSQPLPTSSQQELGNNG